MVIYGGFFNPIDIILLEVIAMSDSDGSRGDRKCFNSFVCFDSLLSEPRLRTAGLNGLVNLANSMPII